MQKTNSSSNMMRVTAIVLDVIMLVYFALYFYWMFGVDSMDGHPLTTMFVTINPMTWGAYMLGIVAVVHLFAFRNVVGRLVIVGAYFQSFIVSLVAIMGTTDWSDFAMYLPHVVIIIIGAIILRIQYKEKRKTGLLHKA